MPRPALLFSIVLLSFALPPGFALAAETDAATRGELRSEILASELRGDDRQTRQLLAAYFERYGRDDPALMMAKAAVLARMDEPENATDWIVSVLEAGVEREVMEADEDLAPLMQSRRVREAVVSDEAEVSRSEARRQMRAWREKYSTERYRPDADTERNLIMLTSLADESHELMRRDLSRQGDWLVEHLFGAYPDDEVLLVLVDPADGPKVFTQRDVAGFYEHSKRRLVAQGTGFTLRHEYVHALHYGDMERRQQLHAFWVLEGLAALFEYYEFEPDGSITFLACAREEQMQRLLASSSLIRWRDLFSMSQMNFVAKGRNTYAHVRSIFQFMAEKGHLEAWYRTYVDTFEEDSTGTRALEIVFGQSIERIERRWREWLRDRPRLPYTLRENQMAIGIEPRADENHDGVKILKVLPDTPAADAGLRRGDVIIAIDGETTPGFLDLRYRLMRTEPGASITIRYRRAQAFESVVIRPQRLSPP